jgi:hypothetical protein
MFYYLAIACGVIALGIGIAARGGMLHAGSLAADYLLIGFGAGCVFGAWITRRGASRVASSLAGRDTAPVYEAKGSTCPTCRRPLLAGVPKCPFCNPVVPREAPLEGTVHEDYRPLVDPVAMPGLAAVAKLKRDAGARGYVHVFEGGTKGQSVLLSTGVVSIGRAQTNTLILADGGVSQAHAEIAPRGNGYVLKDLASKNGTFVNDQRVGEATLRSGDVIAVGDSKMLVNVDG